MESTRRTLLKAATWQLTGLASMAVLGYAITGSLEAAGGLALTSMALSTVCYVLHEKLWARVAWGRLPGPGDHVSRSPAGVSPEAGAGTSAR